MPALHRYLAAVDPVRAGELHPNDQARISRALALHLASGQRPSSLLEGRPQEVPSGWRVLVVEPSREARRSRVARRVRSQVEAGWPEEVAALLEKGHGGDLEALKPLGYQAWIEGGEPGATEARIVQETQAYAKRQATWCRNQLGGEATWDPDHEPVASAFEKLKLAPD
jgi:tRNA dimethylallyltransferase